MYNTRGTFYCWKQDNRGSMLQPKLHVSLRLSEPKTHSNWETTKSSEKKKKEKYNKKEKKKLQNQHSGIQTVVSKANLINIFHVRAPRKHAAYTHTHTQKLSVAGVVINKIESELAILARRSWDFRVFYFSRLCGIAFRVFRFRASRNCESLLCKSWRWITSRTTAVVSDSIEP